jgi:hypothetical protein
MRRIATSAMAALLALSALAPAAAADDWPPPNFVAPCLDGVEWTAEADAPIHFVCGWGVAGGPGKLVTFLKSYSGALIVRDEQDNVVMRLDPRDIAMLWGDPDVFPADDDFVDCAGPTGRVVVWHYWLSAGLPAGEYEVTFAESYRYPVTDGYQTCWLKEDGSRVVPAPSLYRGSWDDVSLLTVTP